MIHECCFEHLWLSTMLEPSAYLDFASLRYKLCRSSTEPPANTSDLPLFLCLYSENPASV